MREIQRHNTLTNPTTPQPLTPTTQTYLEAHLVAFSQARAQLGAARSTLLAETARWVRAMFRPWKGVRYG